MSEQTGVTGRLLVCLLGRHLLLKDRPALVEAHRSRRRSVRAAGRGRRKI